jgi:hypothetical protein
LGLTGNEKMTPELQDQIGLWIYQNQGPGAWEAWGKGGGGGGSVVKSTKGGAPVNGLLDMGQMPEEDQGGIIRLLTGQNKPWASRLNDIGAVLLALSGSPAAQPLLSQIEKRKDRKAQSAKDNKTLAWLASQGRDDLVAAVQGGLPVGNAIQMAMQPPPQPPGPEIREVDGRLVAINPDMSVTELYGSAPAAAPQSSIAKLQADLSAGLITQEQYDVALANMAPPGMVIESDGAGGFRMVQGAGAGAAGGKPFTEGQSKDNVYATRALGALEVLEPILLVLQEYGCCFGFLLHHSYFLFHQYLQSPHQLDSLQQLLQQIHLYCFLQFRNLLHIITAYFYLLYFVLLAIAKQPL